MLSPSTPWVQASSLHSEASPCPLHPAAQSLGGLRPSLTQTPGPCLAALTLGMQAPALWSPFPCTSPSSPLPPEPSSCCAGTDTPRLLISQSQDSVATRGQQDPPRAHLSLSRATQVLGATRSVHTFMEALELPDTAAPPANVPCPGAASSTLPCSCPSTVSWKWKGPTRSTAGRRPELKPMRPAVPVHQTQGLRKALPCGSGAHRGTEQAAGRPHLPPSWPGLRLSARWGTWFRGIGLQDVLDGQVDTAVAGSPEP